MSDSLDAEAGSSVVERTAELLEANYVIPETGQQMAAHLRTQLEGGAYSEITSPSELGEQLTIDLRKIMNDLHLVVYFHPEEAAALEENQSFEPGDDQDTHWWKQKAVDNFGLQRVEILPGNIGYLNLLVFAPASLACNRAAAAMAFLADCDALIFDLRHCGGGDPLMVQFYESYLFGPNPKLMLTFYDRPKNEHQQIWTLPYIPGKRMPDVPVYILTGKNTFSGGEDFAYVMKHHGRATIVGERTDGGGHTIEFKPVGGGYVLAVPTGKPIHPVTGGNWEGTGVEPDIAVPQEKALQKAQLHALETLINSSVDPKRARRLGFQLERQKARFDPLVLQESGLEKFVGTYRSYQARIEDGQLILSMKGARHGWRLVPITETLFIVDEEYNAQFEIGPDGQVAALVWLQMDTGKEIRVPKETG